MSSPLARPQPGASFGIKLTWLFKTVPPDPADTRRKHRRKSAYSDEELAKHIRDRTGEACSVNQVGKWRADKSAPPAIPVVQAIADFFKVPVMYFHDDAKSVAIMAQLQQLDELGDLGDVLALLAQGEVRMLLREVGSMDPPEVSALLTLARLNRQGIVQIGQLSSGTPPITDNE